MTNQKKFWKNIQKIIPNKKSYDSSDFELYNDDLKEMVKPEDTASFINDFFVNIGPSLAEKCKSDWVYNGATANNQLLDILTNEEEVFCFFNFHKETLQGNPLVFRRST